VFVNHGDEFEAHPLTLGRSDQQWSEVLKGIDEGEAYVVENGFTLKSELGKAGISHQH
jgi:membrane fusion protein, heavy metal efflux system